jgi:hypothetical protein
MKKAVMPSDKAKNKKAIDKTPVTKKAASPSKMKKC